MNAFRIFHILHPKVWFNSWSWLAAHIMCDGDILEYHTSPSVQNVFSVNHSTPGLVGFSKYVVVSIFFSIIPI